MLRPSRPIADGHDIRGLDITSTIRIKIRVIAARLIGVVGKGASGHTDDITLDSDGVIGFVGKYVDVVVAVPDEEVMLESTVGDRNLDDIRRAGELLDSHRAGPESRLNLSVLATVTVVLDSLQQVEWWLTCATL